MRTYVLTNRERTFIEAFLGNQLVSKEDYVSYCQLRHQFRKHRETLAQDLALLEKFIDTTRKPPCFNSDDVMRQEDGSFPKKCLECDAEGKCIEAYCRRTGIRP